jgi:hypothetical protein
MAVPFILLLTLFFGTQSGSVVPIGDQVAAFAEASMNKKVGRGECWDLAQFALNKAGATWDGGYGFGNAVDWHRELVMRGDIVQFDQVMIERRTERSMEQVAMGPHTAIVIKVLEEGRYIIAHQNFGRAGRKVSQFELVMADVKKGDITFFRPVR